MKKILVLAIALFCIVAPQKASAQFVKAAVGANLTLPVGNLSDIAGIGFGVTGTGFYNHEGLENITLLGSIGYINMGGEDFNNGFTTLEYTVSVIPVLVGGRYYLSEEGEDKRLFVGGVAGFHFWSVEAEAKSNTNGFRASADGGTTDFAIGAIGGMEMGTIDLQASFMLGGDNYLGVQASYAFDLGN